MIGRYLSGQRSRYLLTGSSIDSTPLSQSNKAAAVNHLETDTIRKRVSSVQTSPTRRPVPPRATATMSFASS